VVSGSNVSRETEYRVYIFMAFISPANAKVNLACSQLIKHNMVKAYWGWNVWQHS
jgi:hypothetical protein